MDLTTALNALMLAVTLLVTALLEKVRRDLSSNTEITKETKAAANGTLHHVMEQLAAERDTTARLRDVVRKQSDQLAYLVNEVPEVSEVISRFRDRRRDEDTPPCMRR